MSFFKRLFGSFSSEKEETKNHSETSKSEDLLRGIYWNFAGTTYPNVAAFAKEIIAYNNEINPGNDLDVDRVFNSATKITVQYSYWGEDEDGDEDELEEEFTITTENESGFTVKEFLFKVHNRICEEMMEQDATYFEGLISMNVGEHPYFILHQGS